MPRPLAWAGAAGVVLLAALLLAAFGGGRHLVAVTDPTTAPLQTLATAAFAAEWRADTGESLRVELTAGGPLSPGADDWRGRLPQAAPYGTPVVFLVRGGNPRDVHAWEDLARPGLRLVLADPRGSAAGRWSYLAAWGVALDQSDDVAAAERFVEALYRNATVLEADSVAALRRFVGQADSDVLVLPESEALAALQAPGGAALQLVVPPLSLLIEPPVVLAEGDSAGEGQELGEAYLAWLYSPAGQALIARQGWRPATPALVDPSLLTPFATLRLFTLDQRFGGWAAAQARHFGPGGTLERILRSARGTALVSR